jgi:hypothetical protein
MSTDNDHYLRHIGYMDAEHQKLYVDTGMLQMPLFDGSDPERTWKTTDSWAEDIERLDAKRATHLGQS